MNITVGISNKHVHLSKEVKEILFGDEEWVNVKDLNQPGQYASTFKVDVKSQNGILQGLRVLGPERLYTQVELAKTDAIKLKINPPVRDSGDLKGSAPITLVGPKGEVDLEEGCIIAARHIHINPDEVIKYNLQGLDSVSIKINSEKSGTIENVRLKVAENSYFEVHLDTDDGNAFLLNQNDVLEIINPNEK